MSEPLGVEERARLREWAETPACPWPTGRWESVEVAMAALLDEVDRLTEALEGAASECVRLESDAALMSALARAERLTGLLAEVTAGALEADGKAGTLTGNLAVDMAAYAIRTQARAERAEADLAAKDEQIECLVADRKTEHDGRHRAEQALADEKRRHAELRAGVEKLADAWEGSHAVGGNLAASLRALLDTATEEASDSDV